MVSGLVIILDTINFFFDIFIDDSPPSAQLIQTWLFLLVLSGVLMLLWVLSTRRRIGVSFAMGTSTLFYLLAVMWFIWHYQQREAENKLFVSVALFGFLFTTIILMTNRIKNFSGRAYNLGIIYLFAVIFLTVGAYDTIFGLGIIPNYVQVAMFIIGMIAFWFGIRTPAGG